VLGRIFDKYFEGHYSTVEMNDIFSERRRLKSWIMVEVALAKAQAKCGVIPHEVAAEIESSASTERIDLEAMKADFDKIGFPILPFVKQFNKSLSKESSKWVHWGATTQDILDTGLILQCRDALDVIERDLVRCSASIRKLLDIHRNSVMPGRTFQQQAAPITFGHKIAIWLDELLRHQQRLPEIRKRLLVGQMAGAVGNFAPLGKKGVDVQKEMMTLLGLNHPAITWHTSRDRFAELVFFLNLITSTLGKIANEISILMRTEVGEVREPYFSGRGGSSAMPQKRNPISCPRIIAIAHRMREFSSTQLLAMIQEHERGVSSMPLEWMIIPEAFCFTSGSLEQSILMLDGLEIDKDQMKKNLELDGGLLMAESVMMGLANKIGRTEAHKLVFEAAGRANDNKVTLRSEVVKDEAIMCHISPGELDQLLEPLNYIGCSDQMIDQVLENYEKILGKSL
jgi:3-carboxy-cis,cis-muconate cycloisomerase